MREGTATTACCSGSRVSDGVEAFERDLAEFSGMWDPPKTQDWPFKAMLADIKSTEETTPRRAELLAG
jgi:hypothetical protein